jgi:uncharacterized protein (TIGR03067 family)
MRSATSLVALGALLLLSSTGAGGDAVKGDLAPRQGTWKRVAAEVDGKETPAGELKGTTLTIEGDRYTLKQAGQVRTGTLKLDSTKSPKQIDIISAAGPNKGKSLAGIYELQGNTFRYCVAQPGKARPTEFSAKAGSGLGLFVNQRATP